MGRARGAEGASPTRGHLVQLDVVRLLTFSAVICVHAITSTQHRASHLAQGVMMLLHFGRWVFFVLTGLVLMHSARRRWDGARAFWRRRMVYVAVPYVAWTAVYAAFNVWRTPGATWSWGVFGNDLADGGAEYHLYFLVVMLQLYLVFPALRRFVRRTSGQAGRVLALSGAANLGWLAVVHYGQAPWGWADFFWSRAYELLPTYTVCVLAGCYAAMYLEQVHAFVRAHTRALLVVAAGAAVVAELAYLAQLGGRPAVDAADAVQPAIVFSVLAALIVVYLAGVWWADRADLDGHEGWAKAMTTASDISFGVYLAHPLVLQLLVDHGLGTDGQRLPPAMATLTAVLLTTVGAAAVSIVARRSHLSLVFTGRPRQVAVQPAPVLIAPASTHRSPGGSESDRRSLTAAEQRIG